MGLTKEKYSRPISGSNWLDDDGDWDYLYEFERDNKRIYSNKKKEVEE